MWVSFELLVRGEKKRQKRRDCQPRGPADYASSFFFFSCFINSTHNFRLRCLARVYAFSSNARHVVKSAAVQ